MSANLLKNNFEKIIILKTLMNFDMLIKNLKKQNKIILNIVKEKKPPLYAYIKNYIF